MTEPNELLRRVREKKAEEREFRSLLASAPRSMKKGKRNVRDRKAVAPDHGDSAGAPNSGALGTDDAWDAFARADDEVDLEGLRQEYGLKEEKK